MKKILPFALVLMTTGIAGAAPNVPPGATGFWRFQSSADKLKGTIGADLVTSNPDNSYWFSGPWTVIEPGLSDGGIVQERSWDFLTVNPLFVANGSGTYVNEYTVAIDYVQTSGPTASNSLFQTSYGGNDNDGDLWTDGAGHIGNGDIGFSTQTYDASTWHRIVWSVDNGSFFRVYVDGVLFVDGVAQAVDGTYSLYVDRFHLFADNSWQDAWGMVGNVAVWNRALTSEEVAGMGGWIGGAAEPTPLVFDQVTTNTAPVIVAVSPADGETNVAPGFSYLATILDSSTAALDKNSVQLLLDGAPVTPVVSGNYTIQVNFSAGGLLAPGTHKYTLSFNTTGVVSSMTNEVTFKVQNYTGYEWRFTNGDLAISLGNGVMSYAATTTEGLTSFGTTDGTTVPHVNGSPAKYMHVPGFPFDTDGYLLTFNSSGPNVGTNDYINRYTFLMDAMLPSPWPSYIALFNTDPYNSSGNDADFYLQGDGSIGIGGGGYSSPGAVASNAWHRIAFVADLKANTLTFYVNGTNVKSRAADGLGGRWSLYSNQDVAAFSLPGNLFLFNEGDTSGVYTHELYVSSIAFIDRALSASELAGLGGPSATGILVPSVATEPSLTIQASTGGATISWPASFVGYRLEQADSLVAPQWKPVAGITNNTATIQTSGTARFFRLSR